VHRLTARQVNLLLELFVIGALITGLASWAIGDRWSRELTILHAVFGLALLLLAPAKMRGSVAVGFRRRRATRWVSAGFGVLVVVTVVAGALHSTGLWFGVGPWTALWTHSLLGFVLIPLFVWHLVSRPVRPRLADVDRRALLRTGVVAGTAAVAYGVQEALITTAGLAGADRRSTGSHELGSNDPSRMPTVIWFNDRRPDVTAGAGWPLVIGGADVTIESLWGRARPVVARLDCTGGWWSEHAWDAVAVSDLLSDLGGRSVRVTSHTGYDRYFAFGELDSIYLAVGYGGAPLRSGHGAPVRLIVPGRRGPWWVKWVTSVEPNDRASWLQAPLPLT